MTKKLSFFKIVLVSKNCLIRKLLREFAFEMF